MTVKLEDFTTFAHGNGVPCHGDLFEGVYNGRTYRAEFYVDTDLSVCLAADSRVEELINGVWEVQEFCEFSSLFNKMLAAITPVLER